MESIQQRDWYVEGFTIGGPLDQNPEELYSCPEDFYRKRDEGNLKPSDIQAHLERPWSTFFAQQMGPIFPEIIARQWVICSSAAFQFPFFSEWGNVHSNTALPEFLSMVPQEVLYFGEHNMVVEGSLLVRAANSLSEMETTLYGNVDLGRDFVDLLKKLEGSWTLDEEIRSQVWRRADICLNCEEEDWTVFARNSDLLARLRHHNRYRVIRNVDIHDTFYGRP